MASTAYLAHTVSEGLTATVPEGYDTESPLQRDSKGGVFKREPASEAPIHMLLSWPSLT